jgi:two-component system nitrate/nitrite sensor histidine kinase NarX
MTAARSGVQASSGNVTPTENVFDSLAYYRYIFDQVNDAIIFHDLTGKILTVNRAACAQLGYTQAELLDMYVQQLNSPESAARFKGHMERLVNEGRQLSEGRHRRKDGSWMDVEINTRVIEFDGRSAVLGVVRDISERRRAESEIQKQNRRLGELARQARQHARQLEAITELVHIVSSARSLDDMFPVFAEQTRRLVDYDRISILLLNPARRQFVVRLVVDEAGSGPRKGMAMPCDEELIDSLQHNPQPMLCPTPDGHERYPIGQQMASQMGVTTSMSLPLMIQDRFLGVLGISRRREPNYQEADVQLLLPVAKQLAVAVENSRLAEQIEVMAICAERDRLGREMHDGLGQVLGSIAVRAETAAELLRQGLTDRARATMEELASLARASCADVRDEILGLRTSGATPLDLEAALHEYLHRFTHEWGIACELKIDHLKVNNCHLRGETQLLRIIQEAMTNVRKHAHASLVTLQLTRERDWLVTTVEDDGCGFDPSVPQLEQFGLQTMRERAESVGGQFRVEAAPGNGTRVVVSLPYRELSESPR